MERGKEGGGGTLFECYKQRAHQPVTECLAIPLTGLTEFLLETPGG